MSVEVVERGGAVGATTALEYGTKHTYGIHKAKETNAWAVGIEARIPKLERIAKSKEIATIIADRALQYAREKGVTLNGAMIGIAYECLRLYAIGSKDEADAIIARVPDKWRDFVRSIATDVQLQNKYLDLRKVRI